MAESASRAAGRWVDLALITRWEPGLQRLLNPMLNAALLLSLLAASGPAGAQYQWKDSRGQVHASDLPPPRDIPDKDVLKRPASGQRATTPPVAPVASPGTAASAPQLVKAPVDPELEARRKRADEDSLRRARADEDRLAAQRSENCQRARQHLAMVASGQRLLRYNERGEPVVIDDAGRADDAQAARRVMATDCR